MSSPPSVQITEILVALDEGAVERQHELLPLVYEELRNLARARMSRERPGQTLQPTALVHEAYLRLVGSEGSFRDRSYFFAAAAEAMRRILIERARSRARLKRGGDPRRTTLDDQAAATAADPEELLDVDRALQLLEAQDAEMAQVAKLRYFSGFTVSETAEILGVSPRGVNRLWTAARAFLRSEIDKDSQVESR